MKVKVILSISIGLLLTGCANNPPAAISVVPDQNPSLTRVRMEIDAYIGESVRWGGVITRVENRQDRTWIELVRQPLRDNGRPIAGSRSDGRFIADFDGFRDPVVYEVGRLLTVVGTIEAKTNRAIGDYDYLFPLVAVEGSFLWKKSKPRSPAAYPPPWAYYYPWYYPWPGPPPPRRYWRDRE